MKKALLYLFAFACVQIFMSYIVWGAWLLVDGMSLQQVLHGFGTGNISTNADMLIASNGASSVLTLLLFVRCHWFSVSSGSLHGQTASVFFWCAVMTMGTVIPFIALQELLPELNDNMKDVFDSLMTNPSGYLVVGIFSPLVEEVVFRGAILSALRERMKGTWMPIILTSLLFALIHMNPAQMPHAFLMGLLLGWLCCKFGTVVPGVVVHWVNNTIAYVVYLLVPLSRDGKLIDIFGSQSCVWLALLFSLMIFAPALYQLIRVCGHQKTQK